MKPEVEATLPVTSKQLDSDRLALEKCILEVAAHAGRIQRERDELLEALKAMLDYMGTEDTEAGQAATTLIARIEGRS